jgi:hypothetical protein
MGFKPAEFLEIAEADREVPTVDLSTSGPAVPPPAAPTPTPPAPVAPTAAGPAA